MLVNLEDFQNLNQKIDEIVETTGSEYIDAVIHYCEVNNIEIETIGELISKNDVLRSKIQLEAEELRRRVQQFADTNTGDVLLRAGNRYELSRLTEWIHAARRDRQRTRATDENTPRPVQPAHDRGQRRATLACMPTG